MSGESARSLPVRVVKVGGSLFDLPDLGDRLLAWIEAQPSAMTVLLAGGGEMVEFIRHSHARGQVNDESAHWLSIEALGVTAMWLAEIVQQFTIYEPCEVILPMPSGANPLIRVFNPQIFFKRVDTEIGGERLPESWDVTSDSIAARLAVAIQADELVLLKSKNAPDYERLEQLSEVGYVDAYFPRASAGLQRIRFENLRGCI